MITLTKFLICGIMLFALIWLPCWAKCKDYWLKRHLCCCMCKLHFRLPLVIDLHCFIKLLNKFYKARQHRSFAKILALKSKPNFELARLPCVSLLRNLMKLWVVSRFYWLAWALSVYVKPFLLWPAAFQSSPSYPIPSHTTQLHLIHVHWSP